jgi:hypothetical protein
MKPRDGAVTNNLADVLQILQLAHKTGLLEVERVGMGNVVEQGTITLERGQVTDARFGTYRGAAAFEMLSKWSTCYFTFQTSTGSGYASTLNTPQPRSPITNPLPRKEPTTGPLGVPVPGAAYRVYSVVEALPIFASTGLTRVHRQLFLLIDGQRTPLQLSRLIGRAPGEVESLLADLERQGFVRMV